ncbi:MAG: S-adenosylmethionine hydrolase [Planctomycetota bacterium]
MVNRQTTATLAQFDTEVVLLGRFGSAITGLEPGPIGLDLCDYEVGVDGRVIPVVDTYSQVDPGSPLALVDSWGHLEIAVRDGDAAQSLGLTRGTQVTLRRCR